MNTSHFSQQSPGEIVAIEGQDHAFVPAPLPPQWEFPGHLWPLLVEAREQLGILEGLFSSPFVRIADLPGQLGVTYPTAKADVDRLVSAGILRELPRISPKTFYSPDVFNVAYEEME